MKKKMLILSFLFVSGVFISINTNRVFAAETKTGNLENNKVIEESIDANQDIVEENNDIKTIEEAVDFTKLVLNIETENEVIGNKKVKLKEDNSELVKESTKETPKENTKKETKKETTDKVIGKKRSVTKSEYDSLCRIVEAEATGQDLKAKTLIANVIFNRLDKSNKKSVIDIIFAPKQFSPIRDGRYYSVTVTKTTIQAVENALDGVDYSQGALYFMNRKYADPKSVEWFDRDLTFLFKYDGHEYFK